MQSQPVKNNRKAKTFIVYCTAIALVILLAIFFLPENTIVIISKFKDFSDSTTTSAENLSNSSTDVLSDKQNTSDNIHQAENNSDVVQVADMAEDHIHNCEKSNAYLRSLQEMNSIIMKFFQDLPYTDHINYVKNQNFPQELQELIARLDEYNANFLVSLVSNREDEQLIFPKNNIFIKKFITVKKVSNIPNDKDELKSLIIKDLNTHIKYLYNYKLPQDSSPSRLEE